jgi:hypothetical protein
MLQYPLSEENDLCEDDGTEGDEDTKFNNTEESEGDDDDEEEEEDVSEGDENEEGEDGDACEEEEVEVDETNGGSGMKKENHLLKRKHIEVG